MLRAIIFDFDGVIVNSEPIILKLTQQMAAQEGWTLTAEDYYRHYLALDDRRIVEHLFRSHGREIDAARRDELVAWKARIYAEIIRDGLPPMPGAVQFIEAASRQFPLAIASGSFRSEVDHLLRKLGVWENFAVLATADDVARSKPAPDVYLKVLGELREFDPVRSEGGEAELSAAQCLVIEDAPAGIEAAHAAGIRCLALTHTRPAEELASADWVRPGFMEIDLEAIQAAFLEA